MTTKPKLPPETELPLAVIRPAPWNARRRFDPERQHELAASIKTHGVLEPVWVRQIFAANRRAKPAYELIAGERRLRAATDRGASS